MRRGLTLIEVLLTAFLLSLVLGMVALLAREYGSLLLYSSKKDQSLSAIQNGLEGIRRELGSATTLISPGGATWVNRLEFERLVPDDGQRRATPLPTPWPPYDAQYVENVAYYRDASATLVREAMGQVTFVAPDVAGFSCQLLAGGQVVIQTSFQEQTRVRTLTTRALVQVGQ